MAAYRITARSLERRLVGDSILKEIADLEECARLDDEEVAHAAVSGRVVFVLEESEEDRPPVRGARLK